MDRVHIARSRNAQAFDAIVLHKSATGEYSFPMHPNAPVPDGFQKVEVTTFQELDRHMGSINAIERRKIEQHVENERIWLNTIEATNRYELRERMRHMSPAGRAFAELAIRMNNAKARPEMRDANVMCDIRENMQSNREEHRDKLTNWQRRRY